MKIAVFERKSRNEFLKTCLFKETIFTANSPELQLTREIALSWVIIYRKFEGN
jgi:hypothetical protein